METIFELSSGGNVRHAASHDTYGPFNFNEAALSFARLVVDLEEDLEVTSAWVRLRRLPDSIYPEGLDLVAWTKQ